MEDSLQMQMQLDSGTVAAAAGIGIGVMIVYFAIIILMIASMWKIFSKAGQPGWAAIIPIYNLIVLLQVVKKPIWWIVLMCIPLVNFIILIIVFIELAKVFGKGVGFGLGLVFLSVIFLPVLAFSDAQYQGGAPVQQN